MSSDFEQKLILPKQVFKTDFPELYGSDTIKFISISNKNLNQYIIER